jgi:hypothetical protein
MRIMRSVYNEDMATATDRTSIESGLEKHQAGVRGTALSKPIRSKLQTSYVVGTMAALAERESHAGYKRLIFPH